VAEGPPALSRVIAIAGMIPAVQQSTRETARPPSEVSLYFEFISLAVRAMARLGEDAPEREV